MMQFSVFEDDNTLGGARDYDPSGLLLRDMAIRISGTQQSALSPVSAAGIKSRLNGKGWAVEQVSHISDGWFPGVSGFTYRLYAVVGTNYSHASVQSQIRRDLDGYFNVNGVSIEADSYQPSAAAPVRASSSGSQPSNNSNLPLPSAYDPHTPPYAGSSGVLDNLGLGLGISTPIVLGVGALALILIMRK